MSGLNVEEQIKKSDHLVEPTLSDRIRAKQDDRTTDEKLFEELFAKTHELQDLVAGYHAEVDTLLCRHRDDIRKIKVALEDYKKATKK